MNFDKYEQLSEDAQRLLCYYVEVGYGSYKRLLEHYYILEHYCFSMFDGELALQELMDAGILKNEGRDWSNGSMRVGVNTEDFVPALWYLHEKRKDIGLALQKCRQEQNPNYVAVRSAVKELVESGYRQCENASAISPELSMWFGCVVQESQFQCLFENFVPETFVHFFENVTEYLIHHDIVVDTTQMLTLIERYSSITEHTRCQLVAEVELYDYIATGKVPSNGIFANISAGYTLGALRHLNNGNYVEAVKWLEMSLKIQNRTQNYKNLFHNGLLTFYQIIVYLAVVTEDKMQSYQPKLREFYAKSEVRAWGQLLPAKILAEDYCNVSKKLHKQQIDLLYEEAVNGVRPALFCRLAFLLANYLGYSTANMDVNLCIPNLALLRHEMAKYLPLYDAERETLYHLYGTKPALTSIYHKAEWESVLEDLMNEATGKQPIEEEQDTRLMYIRESEDSRTIQVREQTRLKNGTWGNGKRLSDARYRKGEVECMNDTDRRILAKLNHSQHWELQLEDVIEEMVDDNRLYFGRYAPFKQVKVERDKPYLMVENEGSRFVVKSNVPVSHAKDDLIIVEESPTHYSLIRIPYEIRDYYVKLLQLGSLPLEAEDTLRNLLKTIGGKVELHSSLIEGGSTLPLIEGQWNIGFKLCPKNSGNWEVEAFVRPLQGGRRTYRPGEGDDIIIDENEEGRARVKRNMFMEQSYNELVRAFWDSEGYAYQEENIYPDLMLCPEWVRDLLLDLKVN